MTHHQDTPHPGFAFDFDPDGTSASAPIVIEDDVGGSGTAGPSTSSTTHRSGTPAASSNLLCAQCSNTLFLGHRTMWALRCGHVVCGDCYIKLGRPLLGKGKGKEGMDTSSEGSGKGKGKASDTEVAEITSRRTRRSVRAVPTTRQLRSSAASSSINPSIPVTPRKRRRAPACAKSTKPAEEWDLHCPVCGRSSGCIKVWESKPGDDPGDEAGEWVWKQDPRTGAIPLYA